MGLLSTLSMGMLALTNPAATVQHVQHEALTAVPHGWSLQSATPANDVHLTYRVAVKHNAQGIRELEQHLLDHTSHPESPLFGQHMSREAINERVRPDQESVQQVVDWLHQHGVTDEMLEHSDNSGFISFTAPVSVGNKLLHTQYNVYKHEATGHQVVRTEAYHLPEHLTAHIDFVSPTTRFPHALKAPTLNSVDKQGKLHPLQHKVKTQAVNSGFGAHPFIKDAPSGLKLPSLIAPTGTGLSQLGALTTGVACNQFVTPKCIRTVRLCFSVLITRILPVD